MTKKPSYRFAGYTEPWEKKKLGELGSVEMCRRIFKEETSDEFEIPFFKIGTFGGKADTFIAREKFEEYKTKYSYPQKGDLLLSASGSIGRVVEYNGEEAYFQDSNIVWLNHQGKINNRFLKVFYEIVTWSGIEGTTIKRLYNKNILETDISLPSLPEQTAIGSFFQDIDQLISLQLRKLEVLKEQKKTYLKLLFPAKGQTKPSLRFAGFEDEWKEVKLGEVTNIKTGGRDVQDSVEDGLYPFYIRSEEVKRINSYSFDGEAILIPGEGRLGEIFHYVNGKFDVHQRVYKISNFTDVDAKFILQQMKKDFKQHAMRNTVKATVDSLRLPTIQSFNIFVPSLPEQEAIGSFFQDLDKVIAKQEEKVNQLKESKQTLLRKMFI